MPTHSEENHLRWSTLHDVRSSKYLVKRFGCVRVDHKWICSNTNKRGGRRGRRIEKNLKTTL